MPYGLKYIINAYQLGGEPIVVELYAKNYIGSSSQLIPAESYAVYQTEDSQDILKEIIGSSYNLSVIGNESFSLEDLYSEDERYWRVVVKRVVAKPLKTIFITWSNFQTPNNSYVDSNLQIKINGVIAVDAFGNESGTFTATQNDNISIEAYSIETFPSGNTGIRLEASKKTTEQRVDGSNIVKSFSLTDNLDIKAYSFINTDFRVIRSGVFTKNNCISGTGEIVTFTKEYVSDVSYVDAQSIANADSNFNTLGQANANGLGTCIIANVIWRGFIPPGNYSEDFTTDKNRVVQFTAVDGISLLSGLGFSQNGGDLWLGKMSPKDIIYNCLNKLCVYDQNLYTYSEIYEEAMDLALDPLHQCKLQLERYLDNNSIPKNTYDTLQKVLRNFGLQLRQKDGDWFVYQVIAIEDNLNFFKYSPLNAYLGRENIVLLDAINCDSTIRFSERNALQTINRPYKQVRVKYEYGLVKSLIDNQYFLGSPTLRGFTIVNPTNLTLLNPGINISQTAASNFQTVLRTDNIVVLKDDTFNLLLNIFNYDFALGVAIRVKLNTGGVVPLDYYMDRFGAWGFADQKFVIRNQKVNPDFIDRSSVVPRFVAADAELSYKLAVLPAPADGNITIEILEGKPEMVAFFFGSVDVRFISLEPIDNNDAAKGEYYIADNPKSYGLIPEDMDVYHADDQSAKYLGTIFRNDGFTPTKDWSTLGNLIKKPLLYIISENILKIYQKPTYQITSSIHGYLSQLAKIAVYDLTKAFFNISLTQDLLNNSGSIVLMEIIKTDIPNFTGVRLEFDYGQYKENRSSALGSGCDVAVFGLIKANDNDLIITDDNFISYGE